MNQHPPLSALEELAASPTPATRELLLKSYQSLRNPATVQALCDLVARLLHIDLDRAQTAAHSAQWLSEQLDDKHSMALCTRTMGNVHLIRGRASEALRCYEAACKAFQQLQDLEQVANTHLNQISALLRVGDSAQVLNLAERARSLFSELRHELGLARLENNLGILFQRQEDSERARVHWQAAYDRFLALGQSHDAAIALRNLAVAAITTNKYREALTLYRKARSYCEDQGLSLLIHEIDYNIAYLYFLRGDYERALLGYRQARSRSQELGDLYHAALCDLDETELYLELNLLQDAAELADRAIASFRKLERRHEVAKALAFRGIAASRLGDPRVAVTYLRSSKEEFDAEGNRAWSSLILLYEALVYRHEGRLFEARRAADAALQAFTELQAHVKIALCYLVLSQLELAEADLAAAKASCDRASDLLETSDLPPLQFQTYFTLGEVHDAAGQPEEAARAYAASEGFLESMRSRVSTEELRLPLITNRLEVYDRLMGLRLETQPTMHFDDAFSIVEKSKARSLSDLLASRVTPVAASTPARSSLVEQVRSLREELNWYYKRFAQTDYAATPPSEESLRSLRASLVETEQELAASLAKVSKADLELGSLHQASSVDFRDVQSFLGDDELVLQYFVGRDVVFLLSFSRTMARCDPIAVPSEVNEVRRLVEFQLSQLSTKPADSVAGRSSDKTSRYLARLYSLLVEPVEKSLRDYGQVTVVPHSFLFYVPFAGVLYAGGMPEEKLSVSLSPSASSLFFSRQAYLPSRKGALEFGALYSPDRFPNLKDNEPWPTTWVPADAPSSEWRALLDQEWFLTHLPLRASYRQDNPVLSSVQICEERQTILDLFSLPLHSRVLVVTGCGHFPGRSGSGDELVALSRSLLYSGPQMLLLPLWPGRQEPERFFLSAFYRFLAEGSRPLQAVAEARQLTRDRYPHPGDWAAWAPFGT